jgi:hypothetical protein
LQRLSGDEVDLECQPVSLGRNSERATEQTVSATAIAAALAICSRNEQVRIGGILHDCYGDL